MCFRLHFKQKTEFTYEDPSGQSNKAGNDQKNRERLKLAFKKNYQSKDTLNVGRNNDQILILIECDLCFFRKLKKMNINGQRGDDLLLGYIWRMNFTQCGV